jgi:alanine dehydrogenase
MIPNTGRGKKRSEKKLSIGLLRMHLEPGERRVFLPGFIASLGKMGYEVTLEKGFGTSIGLSDSDYLMTADQT